MDKQPLKLDTTDRIKNLEEENRRLKARLLYRNSAIANSINAIAFADLGGTILEVNQSFLNLWGYAHENEVIGRSVREFWLHPDNVEEVIRKMFLHNGWVGELIALKKSNRTFVAEIAGSIIYDENQDPVAMFASFLDVSEKLEHIRILAESEKRYRLMAENAANAVFRINLINGVYEYISPSLEQVVGYSPQDFYNNPFYVRDIVRPDFLPFVDSKFEELGLGRIDNIYEFVIVDKEKKDRWLLQHNKLIKDTNGTPIALEGSIVDITEKKQAEIELHELMEELVQLNQDKDRFIRVLAHDLKNPFNTMLGYSKLLMDNIDHYERDKVKKQISLIHNAAQQTYSLLEDILTWVQAQSDKIPFKPEPVFLGDLLHQIKAMYEPNPKRIQILVHSEEHLCVIADLQMIKTILRNLVSNAIKFSHLNSEIIIKAEKQENLINVSVTDHGIGMSSELLDKMWSLSEPINRPGTQGEKGTGLGLLLCKEFVEKHCSILKVESTEGVGSSFSFSLPINKEH